jgi:hypothetical protein
LITKAFLGVTAAFAFKAPVRKAIANPYWQYESGSVTSPSSYTELSGTPSCAGNHNICAVEAPANPSDPTEPTLSSALQTRIENKDTSDGDVFLKN